MTRLLRRILHRHERLDYAWVALFAAVPIAVSWLIGAHQGLAGLRGYWDEKNWLAHVALLPAALFAIRWVMGRIAPVWEAWPPPTRPAVVDLVETEDGRRLAYEALRRALLSPKNLIAALVINLAVHVADTASLAACYLGEAGSVVRTENGNPVSPYVRSLFLGRPFETEADWSTMFLAPETGVGRWENLALNASAYAVQFAVLQIGILFIILLLRHNLFFLFRIYQRRWVQEGEEFAYVHIDLDDDDRCFGFRRANEAFNVQVLVMAVAAAFTLATRVVHVGPGTGLLPDAGQWLSVIVLAGALALVSLPIAVKLLPLLPSRGQQRAPTSLVAYLREFLSDDAWDPARDPVEAVAARFAQNAFWPTGNNRAGPIFFFAFWVYFIVLVPDPRAIGWFPIQDQWTVPVSWGFSGALALGLTWLLFRFLKGVLSYVDPRLVEPPEHPIPLSPRVRRIRASVFISYRRADTAAYAGRLRDGLKPHLDPDRIFMDIATIDLGANFDEVIGEAIASAQAMIVLIGPQWLTLAGEDGRPRIASPTDVVHQEVARGLARGIEVFPICVGGARMPAAAELPEDLANLALLNAHEMSDARWEYDLGVLLERLAKLPSAKTP